MKSDLELIGAAHAKDSALVGQVESLMERGEIDEDGARLLLTLISKGQIHTIGAPCNLPHWYVAPPICTRPHYPLYAGLPSYPYLTTSTSIGPNSLTTNRAVVAKSNEVYTLT